MKAKLFDYIERDNFIYRLSGLTKLIGFFCITFAVMFSYDIRFIALVLVCSFILICKADIRFSQIRLMLYSILCLPFYSARCTEPKYTELATIFFLSAAVIF